jgi:hypothetical protein
VKQNWVKLNQIMLRAKRLNLRKRGNEGKMEVWRRWAKIREWYETRQKS